MWYVICFFDACIFLVHESSLIFFFLICVAYICLAILPIFDLLFGFMYLVDSFLIFLIHLSSLIFFFLIYVAYICYDVCYIYFETPFSTQGCRCMLLGAAIMNLALVTAISTLHVLVYIFDNMFSTVLCNGILFWFIFPFFLVVCSSLYMFATQYFLPSVQLIPFWEFFFCNFLVVYLALHVFDTM